MNNDLISREALLNEFDDKCQRICPTCEHHKWNAKLYRYDCELINTAPTVTPERTQGEWICPNCDLYEQAESYICQYAGECIIGCYKCKYFKQKGGAE